MVKRSFHKARAGSGLYIVFEIPEVCILMPMALTSMLSATLVKTLVALMSGQVGAIDRNLEVVNDAHYVEAKCA